MNKGFTLAEDSPLSGKFQEKERRIIRGLVGVTSEPDGQDSFAHAMAHSIKSAFTLAEVLITLGIIGVVSAMTLPALVNRTQGKELETGLKKAYSVIQNAINKMSYDEGQIVNYANYPSRQFMTIFKKYFKVSKDCGIHGCENTTQDDDGNTSYLSQTYKTYNNHTMSMYQLDDGQVFTSDGMFIMVENATVNETVLFISVDVNGYSKKPNRWGHDLFTFQVMDNGKLLPMVAEGTAYDADSFCSTTSTNSRNGIGCTYKALTDKDYFKNLPK